MRQRALAVAIFAPLLVIFAWIGYHAVAFQRGAEVELKIAGYDPRDLLAGHFLVYRVDYGHDVCAPESGGQCVCLAPGKPALAFWQGDCAERPADCRQFLEGRCEHGRFLAGIERYYFDESYQADLAVVPPESSIRVALDGRGGGHVKKFLVKGEELEAWLAACRAAVKPKP